MSDNGIKDVGVPGAAGDSRVGAQVTLVVLGDDLRAPDEALAAFAAPGAAVIPNYYISRMGKISRLVSEDRAGRGLGRASYQGFLQRIDAIAITVLLQKRPTAGYDGPLLRAVELLLGQLYSRYWIDDSAIHRVVPNPHGVAHVVPYVLPHAPKLPC